MYKTKNKHHSEFDLYDDLEKIKKALIDATSDVKGKAGEVLTQSLEDVKERSAAAQENFSNIVADKPFKSLGIAMLAGVIIGYILNRK